MNAMNPKVSVLMPVYDGERYLRDSIESILNQSFRNFEFLIISDHGTSDESLAIIQSYKDERIRHIHNTTRLGLVGSLNLGIKEAKGENIARMDADDISYPQRFVKQVAFLETHSDYGMVGTWAAIRKETMDTKRILRHPTESLILKYDLLFDSYFVHSSIMIRKIVFEKVGLYSTGKDRQPEDYELWSRVSREFEVANIPEILHIYREVKGSICRTGVNPFLDRIVNLSAENLAYILERTVPDQNITDLAALAHGAYHMLSPKPRLPEISRILFEVVIKLSDSSNSQDLLRNRAQSRLESIRCHYLRYRYGIIFGSAMVLLDRVLKGAKNV